MQFSIKKLLPHLLVIVGFVIISLAYFNPVLQGKQIFQSDIMQYIGMSKQQNDFREATGEETYWTNSAFAGMPTYQLGAKYPHNYIKKLDSTLRFFTTSCRLSVSIPAKFLCAFIGVESRLQISNHWVIDFWFFYLFNYHSGCWA